MKSLRAASCSDGRNVRGQFGDGKRTDDGPAGDKSAESRAEAELRKNTQANPCCP